jgi:hypothetical protein
VVGSEKHAAAGGRPVREVAKKQGLNQAILVMAFFRPWIGEKDQHLEYLHPRGETSEDFLRFRFQESDVSDPSRDHFSLRFSKPIAEQVDADVKAIGVEGSILHQEMSVPATDFQRKARYIRWKRRL